MAYVSSVRNNAPTSYSVQAMMGYSFDLDTLENTVEVVGFDGKNMQRMNSDSLATIIQEVGGITYIAKAAPGTATTEPFWQVQRLDSSTPGFTIITWAGGDALFTHVATDLPSLSYS
jgi:hypothetical protein